MLVILTKKDFTEKTDFENLSLSDARAAHSKSFQTANVVIYVEQHTRGVHYQVLKNRHGRLFKASLDITDLMSLTIFFGILSSEMLVGGLIEKEG